MKYCSSCGAAALPDASFCEECGQPLRRPPIAAAAPAPVAAPTAPAALDAPGPRPRRRRGIVIAVVGLLIGALLIGTAGAVVAARWWQGTAPSLASYLPADTSQYFAVNLDPSGSQKVDAIRLAQQLPSSLADGDTDPVDAGLDLVSEIVNQAAGQVDTVTGDDLDGWFGGQAAYATTTVSSASVVAANYRLENGDWPALAALTVTDRDAFAAQWRRWDFAAQLSDPSTSVGYVITDDVVVIGLTSSEFGEQLPSDATESLASTPEFVASEGVLDDAVLGSWTTLDTAATDILEDSPYARRGERPVVAAGLRIEPTGLLAEALLLGLTPQAAGPAPDPLGGEDALAAVSTGPVGPPLADAVRRWADAYDSEVDGTAEDIVDDVADLLAGEASVTLTGEPGSELGIVASATDGRSGARSLIGAWSEPLSDEWSEARSLGQFEENADVWDSLEPDRVLGAVEYDGDTVVLVHNTDPDALSSDDARLREALPDADGAAVVGFVDVQRALDHSGTRPLLEAGTDEVNDLIDMVDTVGVVVRMPEEGVATVSVRLRLVS